jgi:hypothetical protein
LFFGGAKWKTAEAAIRPGFRGRVEADRPAPPKNKKEIIGATLFYKQATPNGV